MNVTKVDAYDVTVIDKLDWHNTKANAVANEWMLSTVNELVVN